MPESKRKIREIAARFGCYLDRTEHKKYSHAAHENFSEFGPKRQAFGRI
jgi:hypothetical protein